MRKIWTLFSFLCLIFLVTSCIPTGSAVPEYQLLPSKDTIDIGESWVDGGIYVKYGVKVLETSVSHSINNQQEGMYEVTYTAINNNKTYIFKRYVQVLDQIPPVITLNPGIDTIKVGDVWVDGSVQVTDNSGGFNLVVLGSVNTAQEGTYIITYVATDQKGNEARAYRYVRVVQ
jgi:hypothetical protein